MHLSQGFRLLDDFLSHEEMTQCHENLPEISKDKKSGGIRGIEKKSPAIRALISSEKMLSTVSDILKSKPRFVRAILFNKTVENNWMVAWHQDKTVAVSKKFALEGWGPWSIKDGSHHVQPPISVLEKMVTCRIHLDDANTENGCLKVIPYSHQLGILSHAQIQKIIEHSRYVSCEAKAGSMLVMKPHILHASSKVPEPSQRRIIHVEYSSYALPQGVSWA